MTTTPNHELPLPSDGQTPWGDDYRSAMSIIDQRLPKIGGSMYAEGNVAETSIAETGTAVKANIVTSAGPECPCTTHTPNRLTLNLPTEDARIVIVVASFSLTAGNNQTIRAEVRKNDAAVPGALMRVRKGGGGIGEHGAIAMAVSVADGDYLELWVANETNTTAVTVTEMTLALRG